MALVPSKFRDPNPSGAKMLARVRVVIGVSAIAATEAEPKGQQERKSYIAPAIWFVVTPLIGCPFRSGNVVGWPSLECRIDEGTTPVGGPKLAFLERTGGPHAGLSFVLAACSAPQLTSLLATLPAGCTSPHTSFHTARAPLLTPLRAGLWASRGGLGWRGGRRGSLCLSI